MSNLYWIGPRESDVTLIKSLFRESITIYGSNSDGNHSFCKEKGIQVNHNMHYTEVDNFVMLKLQSIMRRDADALFLFYDQSKAFTYNREIIQHTIGLKSQSLINTFSDKLRSRSILQNTVDIIPFISINSSMLNYDFLCSSFSANQFIVQDVNSCGGNGTFLYNQSSAKRVNLSPNKQYIASPYIEKSIPVNTHVFITDNNFYIFPSSVQICKVSSDKIIYHGADYICYDEFLSKKNNEIILNTEKVCVVLQKYGYRGVAGIDWLITNDRIFFVEINARFQASTELLNRAIVQRGEKSLQELQFLYFTDRLTSYEGFYSNVPFSNYAFSHEDITYNHTSVIKKSNEISICQLDGFDWSSISYTKNNPYLFRVVFSRNICSVIQDKVHLHPNFNTMFLYGYFGNNKTINLTYLNIALINHGIRVTQDALHEINRKGTILPAVFDAIDIRIHNDIYINAPYKCALSSFSPFSIELTPVGTALFFYEKYICNAEIIVIPKAIESKKTSSGVHYDSIMQFSSDRIRINLAPVCIYKKTHRACLFCNLPSGNNMYNMEDVKEVIDTCLKELNFRHFLIGGGTLSEEGGWDIILDICCYIRSLCDKDIYIMTIPPKDLTILKKLKNAGVTEVAYNLEIFNRKLAKEIMPGKGYILSKTYETAFLESVKLWGKTGKVRSLVIYGFDSDQDFFKGIERICSIGVEPIISCFRPLNDTPLSHWMPPDTNDVIRIYNKCQQIANHYNLKLGPDCLPCRNNTISST